MVGMLFWIFESHFLHVVKKIWSTDVCAGIMAGMEDKACSFNLVSRRRFFAWAGAAACGSIFAVKEAKAGLFYSTKPVEGIREDWVNLRGLDVLRYANYIKGLRLKNITPYDVMHSHFKKRGRLRNDIPPRHLWKNIAGTLKVIDKMSSHLGAKPKPFTSVYRSPRYNRMVRGRTRSQHLINNAIDVQFYGVPAYQVSALAHRFRAAGHFKGGIGRYSSFTHIDTRGHNVQW